MVEYIVYTDGSCIGNPGPGGRGVVVLDKKLGAISGEVVKLSGKSKDTTNNQMELQAVIESLKYIMQAKRLKGEDAKMAIEIVTDSNYVKDGIEEWIENRKTNGRKTYKKKPIKNKELWQELDTLVNMFEISRSWVKGHAGNKYNEMADKLATGKIK